MTEARRERRDKRMAAIAAAVAKLDKAGICWDKWARKFGLSRQAVINVRKNRGPCLRGAERIAAEWILMLAEAELPPAAAIAAKGDAGVIVGIPLPAALAARDLLRERIDECRENARRAQETVLRNWRLIEALEGFDAALGGEDGR